ncbi:MAG: serine/threonine protein kinase [Phycisphaerales bacterium]|nr:serine/threonine protein kinase [Phycisphaerales bacterium]
MAAAPADRQELLTQSCGSDEQLLARVEAALARLQSAPDLPNQATVQTPVQSERAQVNLPSSIGQFKVRRLIGTGGMGAVYEALQDIPRRKVAVKVMKRGITSGSALRRFQLEAEVLGRLHHPGIAQIYEAGTWDDGSGGVPFFAMEYIAGAKELTRYALDKELDTASRLKLFAAVCDAVHHGHLKGVVHRDLKPGNVLVDRNGNSKVIDFGVARSTDSDLAVTTQQTDVGALIGTLQYMSPEQCEANPDLIDARSDIYALGVMLFELLTGQTPHDLTSMAIYDAARVVREQPARRLSLADPQLRGDLDTIVSKAMAKDPDYRYQSALELKQDIERYGKGEPVSARPLSIPYQLSLLVRRNKAAVIAVASIAAVLLIATVVSIVLAVQASNARSEALIAQQATQVELEKAKAAQAFQRDILAMSSPRHAQGRMLTTEQTLAEAAVAIDERFDGLPEQAAQTRLMIAEIMFDLEMFEAARAQLEQGAQTIEGMYGASDPRVIQAQVWMARVLSELGQSKDADAASRSALEAARRSLPERHPVLVQALEARTLDMLFQSSEATTLKLARQWQTLANDLYGTEHEQTLGAGFAVAAQRYYEAMLESNPTARASEMAVARALMESIGQAASSALGELHPLSVRARTMLAFYDFADDLSQGNWNAEGDHPLSKSLDDARLVFGDDHTFVLDVLHMRGRAMMFTGKSIDSAEMVAASRPFLQRAHEGYVRRFGTDHPSAQALQMDLGQSASTGMGSLTVDQLRASWERLLETHASDSPEVIRPRALLAVALLEAGEVEEGEGHMRATLDALQTLVGGIHPESIGLRLLLAQALIEDDRVEDGVAELDGLLATVGGARDPANGETLEAPAAFPPSQRARALLQVALGYRNAASRQRALDVSATAADLVREHLEPADENRLNVLAGRAMLQLKYGEPVGALETVDVALEQLTPSDVPNASLMAMFEVLRLVAWDRTGARAQAHDGVEAMLQAKHESPQQIEGAIRLLMRVDDDNQLVLGTGEVLRAAATRAHEAMDRSGPRLEEVQAQLALALGDLQGAVGWQEQALLVAPPEDLERVRETLQAYRDKLHTAEDQ